MKLKPDYKKRILDLTSNEELKEVLKVLIDHFEYSIEDIKSLSELTAKETALLPEKILHNVIELKKFYYYYDEKVTVWKRNYFTNPIFSTHLESATHKLVTIDKSFS